jgi:hypothetical protein
MPVLLRLFKKLSPADRRRLCEWTRCRLVNKRASTAALCAYLAEYADQGSACTPERLFAAAFPGEAFHAARIRHELSYLLEAARGYLAWSEWNATPQPDLWLLRGLRRRGLDALFRSESEKALKTLEAAPARNAAYYEHRYQLLQEQLEFATRQERSARLNLQPLPDALTVYYAADMLRHACAALTHQAVAGQNYRFALLDTLLDAVEKENLLSEPVVEIYYRAYQMLKNTDAAGDSALSHLIQLLEQHSALFGVAEMRGLYLLAINGCIRRMNAGQRDYIRTAFELYRTALLRGFLLEEGWISGFTYRNIIRIGAALKETAWTEQFLHQYRDALHPRERQDQFTFNQAYLFFQQQDYTRAMPLLLQLDFADPLHQLEARRMLLRSYYELGEWQALDALLHSFGAYLRRQKNLGYHRATNERLLYFIRKLLEIPAGDRAVRARLRAEIEATPDVAERQWLLSQG